MGRRNLPNGRRNRRSGGKQNRLQQKGVMALAEKEILIRFLVSDEQKKLIQEKMKLTGIRNMSGYLRKMAIDGYIINVDLSCIKEMIPLLRNATNNMNQIAKRVNETGNIYQKDIAEVNAKVDGIWDMMEQILKNLAGIYDL